MSIDSLEYLTLAKEILQFNNEAAYRTTASRAYYACFHFSKDMASSLDDAGGTGMHERHIRKFTKSVSNGAKGVGYMLQQSHSVRVKADYKLDCDFEISNAEAAILSAERLIQKIEDLS